MEISEATLVLVALLVGAGLASLQVSLNYRRATSKDRLKYEEARLSEVAPESVDDLSRLLVQNFKVLNAYYSENLSQSRTSTLASIAISLLGFIVIVAGILIAFIGREPQLGSVASAAGIISQVAAALFFRQNRLFQRQMNESLKKLVSTQYLMTSVALARELPEDARIDEVRAINEHLRTLMSGLHQFEPQEVR